MQQLQTLNPDSSPNLRVSKPLFQGTRVGGGRRLPDLLPSPAPEVQSQKMKLPAGREGPVLFLTLSQCSSLQTSRRHPRSIPPAASSSLPEPGGDPGGCWGPFLTHCSKTNHEGHSQPGSWGQEYPQVSHISLDPMGERTEVCGSEKEGEAEATAAANGNAVE